LILVVAAIGVRAALPPNNYYEYLPPELVKPNGPKLLASGRKGYAGKAEGLKALLASAPLESAFRVLAR
jgi:hypothetical protein